MTVRQAGVQCQENFVTPPSQPGASRQLPAVPYHGIEEEICHARPLVVTSLRNGHYPGNIDPASNNRGNRQVGGRFLRACAGGSADWAYLQRADRELAGPSGAAKGVLGRRVARNGNFPRKSAGDAFEDDPEPGTLPALAGALSADSSGVAAGRAGGSVHRQVEAHCGYISAGHRRPAN